MEKRDEKIKQLRRKRWTYKRIGDKFGISQERVRQICTVEKVDRTAVIDELKRKYKKRFNHRLSQKHLLEDIEELSKQDRNTETVIKRGMLIIYLIDELEIPAFKVGILLHRDHTTIAHLYNKFTHE